VSLTDLLSAAGVQEDFGAEWADIELKYAGYLQRERRNASRMAEMEGLRIPGEMRYDALQGLSFEARQKLDAVRPATLGQAGRVPGVSPSDLQNLVFAVLKARV
jgi:tRNA uridine 5-carboxymethylaminomethyl modification enzyme